MASESSGHDIRCSQSCARAGLAALVLSAVALSMLQPLTRTRDLDSLLQYFSLRLTLIDELDRLDADAVWKSLTNSEIGNQAAKEWRLAGLLEYKTTEELLSPTVSKSGTGGAKSKKEAVPGRSPPAAPKMLRLTVERRLEPVHAIADVLTKLGDGTVLTRARQYSYRYDRSIYRWANLRLRLLTESMEMPFFILAPKQKDLSVPSYSRDELIKYLTLPQIIELASYDQPTLSEVDLLLKEQSTVHVPTVGIAISLIPASVFLELTLLLAAFYFWLYYREARTSDTFPAPGTLFGAFARTQLFRLAFLALLAVPPISAALLALRSFWILPANSVVAVLVLVVAFMVQREKPLLT